MSGNLPTTFNEPSYAQLLNQVKSRIRDARVRAGLATNRELVALYWGIGKLIVKRLSRDVRQEFPDIQSFST